MSVLGIPFDRVDLSYVITKCGFLTFERWEKDSSPKVYNITLWQNISQQVLPMKSSDSYKGTKSNDDMHRGNSTPIFSRQTIKYWSALSITADE